MQALLFVADECPHMVPRQEIYVRTRPGRGVSCCVICRSQVYSARVFVDVFNDQIQHVAIDWKLVAAYTACLASPEMVW